ncbi:unannotated protein [freshwater metagenome]
MLPEIHVATVEAVATLIGSIEPKVTDSLQASLAAGQRRCCTYLTGRATLLSADHVPPQS